MDKKELLWNLALLSFVSILFMPLDSEVWKKPLFLGVIFGVGWWFKK